MRYDLKEGEATSRIYSLVILIFLVKYISNKQTFVVLFQIKDGKFRDAIDILNYQTQINSKVLFLNIYVT